MISFDEAYTAIKGKTLAELGEFIIARLSGEHAVPLGNGYFSEASQDVITQLLRKEDLAQEERETVIKGCKKVFARIMESLSTTENGCISEDVLDRIHRFCDTLDIASPNELQGEASSFLMYLLKSNFKSNRNALTSAVSAWMSFPQTKQDIPLWEELLKIECTSAFAFNALVDIDPAMDSLKEHLIYLWEKKIKEQWKIDVPFLMLHLRETQGSDDFVVQVLSSLQETDLWFQIFNELQPKEWAREWFIKLKNLEIIHH